MCRAINHDTGGIRSDQGSCFDTYRHNVSAYRSLNPMKSQVRLLQRELRYIVVFETRVREGFIFINVHNKNEVGQMQFFLSFSCGIGFYTGQRAWLTPPKDFLLKTNKLNSPSNDVLRDEGYSWAMAYKAHKKRIFWQCETL